MIENQKETPHFHARVGDLGSESAVWCNFSSNQTGSRAKVYAGLGLEFILPDFPAYGDFTHVAPIQGCCRVEREHFPIARSLFLSPD